ncbi:Hexapep domain-containing protein [Rhizoctonia solani AG-1 IA]|uniref:Dynactin subunit 6 n=1 Tax=Thanatephorus cucumeris (strain AG1-IA) TaxID=983506 RepID=L8X606_THACA|nr:Hexapep domain-containing protein [Rhizoctonia solani AG-1 IA]
MSLLVQVRQGLPPLFLRPSYDTNIHIGTVVHPKATIFAMAGPIIIGAGCIIEEIDRAASSRRKETMRIGDSNLLEIGCRIECPSIGDMNTVGARSRLHHTVRLGNYCVIGAGCMVVPSEDDVLDDFTVVYGPTAERRTWSGRGKIQEADLRQKHVEYLREMLPKFNRLRRTDNA